MSLWTRILESISAFSYGKSLADILEGLTKPPEKTVAFAIAVIGLSAKMAKADGLVTRDEVAAFREIFYIDKKDEANAAKVFNLARQDVEGFESYARSIAKMFSNDKATLEDLLEGLFYIASSDGIFHKDEEQFLLRVCEIFRIEAKNYRAIRSRSVPSVADDPYCILGVEATDTIEEIKKKWQRLVKDNHPDTLLSRGVPEEAIKLATSRMVSVNAAWESIKKTQELAQ